MLPASFFLLTWLHASPEKAPSSVEACEDLHVELARSPVVGPREVCISPGRLTGFVFDVPIGSVEVQDEVRFVEVNRGQRMLGLMPPSDLQTGERLRLTVELVGGESSQTITFVLVAQQGLATHQVQVFRDPRPAESLRQETEAERAKNRRLQEENERLRSQFEQHQGLGYLLAMKRIGTHGVKAHALAPDSPAESTGGLSFFNGRAFRIDVSVTAEIWLQNDGSAPWIATGAVLMNEGGEPFRGLQLLQAKSIEPGKSEAVVVELKATDSEARGPLTLRIWDDSGRAITLTPVVFPTLHEETSGLPRSMPPPTRLPVGE